MAQFQQAHRQWVEEALTGEMAARDDRWSEAIAVGSLAFVNKVKVELGIKAMFREVAKTGGAYTLRGSQGALTQVILAEKVTR
ncbi:MAG: hypothetical protein A3F74_11915 [Betaproteobacteria bacterium RIFCSPLOWO2_12_FULL_62_58]|nr:MAG: hypothetical protein A3F74_11915 [Betaproteobacteria bacterium RIFCSPLOWO2_12_FULL_62_58]